MSNISCSTKIPCDIIRDLLPLYADQVCSEKSKDMIEMHLSECEECRVYLESLSENIPLALHEPLFDHTSSEETSDVHFIKKIKQNIFKQKIIFSATLFLIFFAIFFIYDNPTCNETLEKIPLFDKRIPVEDIHITEIYQLDSGHLYFTLKSDSPFNTMSYFAINNPDPANRSESYDDGYNVLSLRRSRFDELLNRSVSYTQMSFIIPFTESVEGKTHESIHFYYEGKQDETLTIWKDQDTLEEAPDYLEELLTKEDYGNVIDFTE